MAEQEFIGGEGGDVILGEGGGEPIAEEFTPIPNPVAPQDKFPVTEVPCNRNLDAPTSNKVCHPSNETVSLGDDLSYLQVGGGLNGQGAVFFDPERMLDANNQGEPDSIIQFGLINLLKRARWNNLNPARTYLAHTFNRTYSVRFEGPIP